MAIYFTQNTNNVEDIEQMNNVIDKVNQANTTATSNIGQLTDLNNKAQELSNDIQQALPINTELKENIKIGQPLVQEATTKNTELQASLEKTKEFINGLDGSQNIPQIRMDVTELQNGLKSNQSLAYKGSSIGAENTLEGRTEGMVVKGRTLQNLFNIKRSYISTNNKQCVCESSNSNYSNGEYTLINLINKAIAITIYDNVSQSFIRTIKILGNEKKKITLSENEYIYSNNGVYDGAVWNGTEAELEELKQSLLVLRGDYANVEINSYFEGIKSFGESEQEGDKYKISILSNGKNLFNKEIYLNSKSYNTPFNSLYSWLPIKVKPNTKYNFNVLTSDLSKLVLISSSKDINSSWFIDFRNRNKKYNINKTSNEQGEFYIGFYDVEDEDIRNVINNSKIQITEGEALEEYEPYIEDKKDILIKEPLRENDVLYEDNGQVKVYRPTKQYTFTGNETIIFIKAREKTICFNVNFTNDGVDNSLNVMCNNFLVTALCYSYDVEGFFGTKKGIFCSILKSKLTTPDIEGFKAWLKANPTKIVYQLAEPTTEIVENCVDIDLDTFGEKTYFNIENSIKGSLDFKVPSNIASIVQNTAREVNNIWDVINNLLVPSLIDINKNVAMSTIKNNLK